MKNCNSCAWINVTEQHQTNKKEPHKCNFYEVKLFHRCNNPKDHEPNIYPCCDCINDEYKAFM